MLVFLTVSKLWTLHLFKQIEVSVCYDQVNLQRSLGACAHYAIGVSILKQHKNCFFEEEVIAMLEDTRVVTICVQKKDADVTTKLETGKGAFQLILDLSSKLKNIILFFPRTMQNSSYHKEYSLEAITQYRRLTHANSLTAPFKSS